MEKPTLEGQFKDSFTGAEITPSSGVWNQIEFDLMRAESRQMKRRVFFYQMLAAACAVFALMIGAFSWYQSESFGGGLVAENVSQTNVNQAAEVNEAREEDSQHVSRQEKEREIIKGSTAQESLIPSESLAKKEGLNVADRPAGKETASAFSRNTQGIVQAQLTAPDGVYLFTENNYSSGTRTSFHLADVGAVTVNPDYKVAGKKEVVADPVQLMLARLAAEEARLALPVKKSSQKSSEKLWTSLGVAAGGFTARNSSVTNSPSTSLMAASNAMAGREARASGQTYSVGLNVGTRLSQRWVFQGGVNYQTQNSEYTAETAIGSPDFKTFQPASINVAQDIQGEESVDAKIISTSPYSVNNIARYLSLPLQAGYLIVDKKVGFQLNAGVSTDFFLRNTKDAEGANIQDISQGRDDSPYRPVNFSGLMGAEVSYKFSKRYRLAVNPGVRYPFNSIYRSSAGVKASPLSYDVGLRFRYIFN